jgi:hypothetical protein
MRRKRWSETSCNGERITVSPAALAEFSAASRVADGAEHASGRVCVRRSCLRHPRPTDKRSVTQASRLGADRGTLGHRRRERLPQRSGNRRHTVRVRACRPISTSGGTRPGARRPPTNSTGDSSSRDFAVKPGES